MVEEEHNITICTILLKIIYYTRTELARCSAMILNLCHFRQCIISVMLCQLLSAAQISISFQDVPILCRLGTKSGLVKNDHILSAVMPFPRFSSVRPKSATDKTSCKNRHDHSGILCAREIPTMPQSRSRSHPDQQNHTGSQSRDYRAPLHTHSNRSADKRCTNYHDDNTDSH